jgi:carbon monoxide dehydrogenase subunit G
MAGRAMRIEERFLVNAPIAEVWKAIRDPAIVAPCIPGCSNVEVTGERSYRAEIRVELGPIKTSFKVDVTILEERPEELIASVTRGEEGGKASTLSATNEVRLSAQPDGGTEVAYRSEVSIFGRLGKFGMGIMQKKAKNIGEAFALALRDRLAGSSPSAKPAQ